MGTIGLIILLALSAAAMLYGLARIALWRACRNGARKIHRELTAMFGGEHEFRIVPEDEARAGQSQEATELRGQLRAAGFRPLGWIEDLTVTAVYPRLRTFIEVHASADGRICATTYRTAGLRLFDLGTRLAGDRFIVTTNAEVNKLKPPPSTDRETLPYTTSFADLHARHLARLEERRPGPSAVRPCRNLSDVLAASRLYSRQASEHRRSLGYLSEAELLEMGAGAQREEVARRIWREFRRLQATDRRAA